MPRPSSAHSDTSDHYHTDRGRVATSGRALRTASQSANQAVARSLFFTQKGKIECLISLNLEIS